MVADHRQQGTAVGDETLPRAGVDTVQGMDLLGARVMRGSWQTGESRVVVAAAEPLTPRNAALAADRLFREGDLPDE